ncbi:MAG: hypothetical protein HY289_02210 [Planctomycetes bacterium]|nr:hypothetical protein [Planctomycetota bacterium]
MPKIFRSMHDDGGKPKVGSGSKMLGVRGPPDPHADLPVDPNGNVHPQTGGMSVAPDWRKRPYFLVPMRLRSLVPRARGSNDLDCWRLGDGDFETVALTDKLDLRIDQGQPLNHGVVEPKLNMSIVDFQDALAQTCDLWVVDET